MLLYGDITLYFNYFNIFVLIAFTALAAVTYLYIASWFNQSLVLDIDCTAHLLLVLLKPSV